MRPNFYEQPHFVLYNYSLLSPSFFTSVTLSDWKPLSVSVDAPFLTPFFMSGPAGFLPSQLPSASLFFSLSPFPFPSSPFYLKTDRLSFSRQCNLSLALPGAFRSCSFLPPCDNREIRRSPILLTSPSSLFVSLEPRFLRILNPVANCDPTRRDRNGEITPRAPSVNK